MRMHILRIERKIKFNFHFVQKKKQRKKKDFLLLC